MFILFIIIILSIIIYFKKKNIQDKVKIAKSQFDFTELTLQKLQKNDPNILKSSLPYICNLIATYFENILNKKGIGCAIRLSFGNEDEYVTCARSTQLTPSRENTTQPINSNQGIPKFLTSKEGKNSILIFNDHELVLKCHHFIQKNNNHGEYLYEEKSLAVIPIYYENIRLIGMIFITSKYKYTFKEIHINNYRIIQTLMTYYINIILKTCI